MYFCGSVWMSGCGSGGGWVAGGCFTLTRRGWQWRGGSGWVAVAVDGSGDVDADAF
jgi:hypothetical protein